MKNFLTIALLLVCVHTIAQKGNVKLYAFKEPVIGGAYQQNQIEEGGKETKVEQKSGFNYLIYLASDDRVYPSEIWINGNPYSAGLEAVTTPVSRQNFTAPGKGKMELVPLSDQKVIQLKPGPAIKNKLSKEGKTLAASNELVVIYKQNGKFYQAVVNSFTLLEPVALQ